MSINIETTGVQPATDEAIRLRLLQELNKAYAEAPRFAEYAVTLQLATWGGCELRWQLSAQTADHCICSYMADTPQIAGLQLGHKFRQQPINASKT